MTPMKGGGGVIGMDSGLPYRHDGIKTSQDEVLEKLQLVLTIIGHIHNRPDDREKVTAKFKLLARARVTSRDLFPTRSLASTSRFRI